MPSLLPTHSSAPGDKTVFIKGTVLAILWTFNNGAGGTDRVGAGQQPRWGEKEGRPHT